MGIIEFSHGRNEKRNNQQLLASTRVNDHTCLKFGDCLVGVWILMGGCLDGVWWLSKWWLKGVWRVSINTNAQIFFWTQHLLDLKLVWTRKMFRLTFFLDPNIIGPKIFLDLKIFWTQHFVGFDFC